MAAHEWIAKSRLVLVVFFCWALTSLSQLDKYLTLGRLTAVFILAFAGIAAATEIWVAFNLKSRRDVTAWVLGGIWLVLAVAVLLIHPLSLHHAANAGGDREDAIRVEIQAIMQHRPPYTARTVNGNVPTPMPGALLFASPFYWLHAVYLQNLLWTGLFALSLLRFFSLRATVLFFFLIFLLLHPGNLNDMVVGGDFCTNLLYVLCAFSWIVLSEERGSTSLQQMLSCVLLGIAISSRVVYVVALPIAFAYLVQKKGWATAARMFAFICMVSAAVTLPFYFRDPRHLLPQHISGRADLLLPAAMHPAILLPCMAILVAMSGFWIRLSLERIFFLFGLSMAVMLLPPLLPALLVPFHGYPRGTNIGVLDMEYTTPATLPLALYFIRRFERRWLGLGSTPAGEVTT